jgi:hypothetical protein
MASYQILTLVNKFGAAFFKYCQNRLVNFITVDSRFKTPRRDRKKHVLNRGCLKLDSNLNWENLFKKFSTVS